MRLENTTGEAKRDWPVFLPVASLFGGNLPVESLARGGFAVRDASGAAVGHMRRRVGPHFSIGNDEIMLRIPQIGAGESRTYRILHVERPAAEKRFDPAQGAYDYAEAPWRIGCASPTYPKFNWPMRGLIDDVRLYDRALSADEVRSLSRGR